MTENIKQWLKCIALPLILGGISWLLSRSGLPDFQNLVKPSLTPPAIVFPIVWVIFYITMGTASCLIKRAKTDPGSRSEALFLYGLHLVILFFWPILFFRLKVYFIAFIWLLFLWAILWMMIQSFYAIRKSAGLILIPYLLWVSFAAYLNLAVSLLN